MYFLLPSTMAFARGSQATLALTATLNFIASLQCCWAHPVREAVTSQDYSRTSHISGISCFSGPLGMASGAIPDSSLTASGSYSSRFLPSNARLNGSTWWACPKGKVDSQWIQVDLGHYTAVTGVILHGHGSHHIHTFAINFSSTVNAGDWHELTDKGRTLQLNAINGAGQPVMNVKFPVVLLARFLRIIPLTWTQYDHYYLKFEVLGCRVSNGTIRLVGSDDKWSGQVEIYRHGAWGAVCDTSWDMKDATTVCNQLGFIGVLEAKTGLSSRESDRPIVMNRVTCNGTERQPSFRSVPFG
ncbi:contactin-associated protein-like 4 [Acanthaster planci]|uniref:Contactin-associated protein-like 4 n=1 Tax=Acanthaster planci TaxID=133434 RepID=A0A8B7Z8E1_ACAPL|nr:contactin-associated protein-like 4 [Acanthaster planci]